MIAGKRASIISCWRIGFLSRLLDGVFACRRACTSEGLHAFPLAGLLAGLVSRKHAVMLTSWPNGSPSRLHASKPAAWNGCRRTIHPASFQAGLFAGWH
jgi:hypothetical protein